MKTTDDAAQDVIFDTRANRILRAIFIKGNEPQATPQIMHDLTELPFRVSEMLMHHEGVCFSVYGENVIIPLLLHSYGVTGLLKLLEQGAIKFCLASTAVVYWEVEREGLLPLAPLQLTDPTHSDPEASLHPFFSRTTIAFETKARRRLKRALTDAYVQPSVSFAPGAVEFANQGYRLGRLKHWNLVGDKSLEHLNKTERAALAGVAEEMHNLSVISALKMHTLDDFTIAQLCDDSIDRLERAKRLDEGTRQVFSIEGIPSLHEMFGSKQLSMSAVPRLRLNREACHFREWMRKCTADRFAGEISEQYLSAISSDKSVLKTRPARILKTMAVSAVSSAVGAAIGGIPGAAMGALGGPIVDMSADVLVDQLDELVLERLIQGWKPRNYVTKLKKEFEP